MKYADAFPSKWLVADDLDHDLVVTISSDDPVSYEEFRTPGKATPDSKPILKFKAPKGTKPLILNKTNWKTIGQVLGSVDTDDWAGQQITLYAAEVEAFGEMTTGVRVRAQRPQTVKPDPAVQRARAQRLDPDPDHDECPGDDGQGDNDLPF